MVGAAMDKARAEMETKNISIGNGVHINVNGHEVNAPDSGAPHAEITPQGDLLIAGKAVDVTPAQRKLLLEYRGEVIGVASAGMEIGKQGVDIAGKALNTAVASIFNGKSDQAEQEMKAQGDRIEAAAMKLCDQLPAMLQTQQKLAAELPAFKPYANMAWQRAGRGARLYVSGESHPLPLADARRIAGNERLEGDEYAKLSITGRDLVQDLLQRGHYALEQPGDDAT